MSLILDASDRVALVRSEVTKVSGKRISRQNYTMVQCPFHNDGTPSGQIKHDVTKPRSIGYFACRGCGKHMPWSDFATALSLEPFQTKPEASVPDRDLSYLDDEFLGEGTGTIKKEAHSLYPLDEKSAERMGLKALHWRGFDFDFLHKVGCRCIYLEESSRFFIYMPVYVGGTLRGYIKGFPIKPAASKNLPTYFNAGGSWSAQYGLFPYDYAVALMGRKNLKTLVLVEGPRDALRLCREGIPAICILGTQSWSHMKVRLLEQSGAETIILCMDADAAGRKATKLLYRGYRSSTDASGKRTKEEVAPALHTAFNTYSFPLADYKENPDDPEEKMDPFSAPDSAIVDLRNLLE